MADQRCRDIDDWTGAGSALKADTLNRLDLVETDADGHGKYRWLKHQAADPETGAGEGVVYAKSTGLYYRLASNGAIGKLA
ncbi:MAG: hypothetical protein HY794_15750 [Desulfarculus sp.]|nr:hypothetical protein [Desulfarculus sp.]